MKKAIVTGGLGFLGSHLVDKLLQKNIEIIIIDNKVTSTVDENYWGDKCKVLIGSIQDTNLNSSIFNNVDAVFHLASIVGPVGVLKHAGDIGKNILGDNLKLRDFCIKNEALLVDVSTSEVYGHGEALKEESQKVFRGDYKVRTEYGAAKMVAEMSLTNKALLEPKLKYHIIRPFNITGPRQRPDGGFVLPRFIISALTNQPITVYGDGSAVRSFTDVRDICDGILTVVDNSNPNEMWNVGNPNNKMTILELAELVNKITYDECGKKSNISFVNPTIIHGDYFSEPVDKVPYIEKIKNNLGWKANIKIENIIKDTILYYDNKIKNEKYNFSVM